MSPRIHPNLFFAAYALLAPLALGLLASWDRLRTLPDAAAWVQALGSIGAICAAIWIDRGTERRLHNVARRERLERDLARITAVDALGDELRSIHEMLRQGINIMRMTGIRSLNESLVSHLQERRADIAKHGVLIQFYLTSVEASPAVMVSLSTANSHASRIDPMLEAVRSDASLEAIRGLFKRVGLAIYEIEVALNAARDGVASAP